MNDKNDAAMPSAGPQHKPRTVSVRGSLVWLVLICLLPGVVGSAAVLYVSYRTALAQLEQDAILSARALSHAVDAELAKAVAAARALSTSPHLAARDFAAFHAQASETMRQVQVGNNFVLSDAGGQQLVNTVRPYPGPLPRHGNPAQLRRVFDTGAVVVSDVYIGGVLRRPVMSIDVPVMADGRVMYDLSIGIFPERLGLLVQAERLPADWVVSIFDSQGVHAAHSHAAAERVGRPAAAALLQRLAGGGEGLLETVTPEGLPMSAVFSRSDSSRWSAAIEIPTRALTAQLRSRFAVLLAVLLVLLAAGLALASFLADRIARSITALTAPALALGAGTAVAVPPVHLREAAEVGAAIATAADLLARRTQELEGANRELQEFSYAISHDLRTPLRAIAGYAQIVAEEHGGQLDDEGKRLLSRVRSNTVRMGRLIDSLLDFMHMARHPLDWQPVDMRQLVGEVFDELSATAPQRQLELQCGELPPARGDRALLRRVLECLLGNAIKFIPPDAAGVVVASGEAVNGETIYHVKDNGVGFDMRYADKLFRVFERAHSPREFEGIGIGLAIVKRIVGRHGGRVWAEGAVGAGATFHFALPAVAT